MTDAAPTPKDSGLMVRIALLEARVRLITIVLEGIVVVVASALLAYFFKAP